MWTGLLEFVLILIYTIDYNNVKRSNHKYPECFTLTNSKRAINYEKIFQSVKNILTGQNKLNLKLKSATMDFEKDLHNGFLNIFEEIKEIQIYNS